MSSKNRIVRPFNMAQDEYEKMFESSLPDSLMMMILLAPVNEASIKMQIDTITKVKLYLSENSENEFVRQLKAHPQRDKELYVDLIQNALPVNYDPEKGKLLEADLRVQIGFYDANLVVDTPPTFRIAAAMIGYDRCVAKSGSIEPKNHVPFFDSEEMSTWVNKTIGNFYTSGKCIWCRELVEKRNMWAVTVKALQLGRDPESEWTKFINAGGWYYTQYPKLCL